MYVEREEGEGVVEMGFDRFRFSNLASEGERE